MTAGGQKLEGFSQYYERTMRAQASESYWDKVGLSGNQFGGYDPVVEDNKTDIRVATVLECTPVKKSDRLLQFRLDDGMGGRTILSGIAQSYPDPSVLVGKQVLYIANFPPRKMMGIESQGMILSAVNADGKLVVTTVTAPVRPGAQVG